MLPRLKLTGISPVGNVLFWRDELQPLIGARLESPASDIIQNHAEGSLTFKTSARYATDYVMAVLQLNHDWIKGTVIHPHLHWWQTTTNVPNWLIGYRWQREGQAKTTAWTNLAWDANLYTWTAGTLNQITDFPAIAAPGGYGYVSDIIQFRIYRDVTNVSTLFAGADPVGADQDAVQFDIHKQVDFLGSPQEWTK